MKTNTHISKSEVLDMLLKGLEPNPEIELTFDDFNPGVAQLDIGSDIFEIEVRHIRQMD